MQVGDSAKTRWGQTVCVTSRYLVDGRMYCTYEYGLGGCSEGGAWENELQPQRVADSDPPSTPSTLRILNTPATPATLVPPDRLA